MTMNAGVRWKDLETKGFVHVPSFLSDEELAACRADYAEQPVDIDNRNYTLSAASERGVGPVRHRIQEVLTAVSANTSLKVDLILGGTYFATRRGIVFKWHQDHESYFVCQNHFDYLNFYIPVFKPLKNKSNLCLLPFDVLERESPKTFRRVVGRGASGTFDLGGRQLVLQDDPPTTHLARVNLEDLICTPQLEAGDLLLLRGDVFHRTEDDDTERVALSVRATHTKTVIHRAQLADGGLTKASMMARNPRRYALMFRAFDEAGRNELPLGELMTLENKLSDERLPDSDRFRTLLLKEKIRGGVFFSSVQRALSETVVRPIVARYHWRRLQRARTQSAPNPAARTT
jgi:hypothetical protein